MSKVSGNISTERFVAPGCMGTTCSEVRYNLVGADIANLRYLFESRDSKPSNGLLLVGNNAVEDGYVLAWYSSLALRVLTPPFSGGRTGCGDDCDCVLGPEFSEIKSYSHVLALDLPPVRSRITITGDFRMKVTARTGVCVPASKTAFGATTLARVPLLGGALKLDGKDPASVRTVS